MHLIFSTTSLFLVSFFLVENSLLIGGGGLDLQSIGINIWIVVGFTLNSLLAFVLALGALGSGSLLSSGLLRGSSTRLGDAILGGGNGNLGGG